MRVSWFRVDPDSDVWCPSLRREGLEAQGKEGHVKTEAESGVTQQQAKARPR